MIRREKQHITQPFSPGHLAVDLRCWDFGKRELQPCIAPEKIEIIRTSSSHGKDGYGNNFLVYRGLRTGRVLKSIHVRPVDSALVGVQFNQGEIIGWPEIGGNSPALHEHFETLYDDDIGLTKAESLDLHFNPCNYFDEIEVEYE